MKTTELETTVKALNDEFSISKSKVSNHDLLVMWGMYELARIDQRMCGKYTIRCHRHQMNKDKQKKLANAVIEYSMTKPEERGQLDGTK